jgi:poly-beta-1,6-N-acetyl-D-glucosamine synthase
MPAWQFLGSLDTCSLVLLFWYMLVLEVPRYCLGAIVLGFAALCRSRCAALSPNLTISVLLVGHNEAHALNRCVYAMAEQSVLLRSQVQIVVVDDGSTDGMIHIARELRAEGLVDDLLRLVVRGGKSAGINLGLAACRGEIVVIMDVDTTLDRDALEKLLPYFADPRVGGVAGNLGVRNADTNLVTRYQQIEYLVSISLGRRVSDLLGTLSIVSGAFGAFRRSAVLRVGGLDVEVSEDADLTMKLRRAGWRIRFAPEAMALTQVPETIPRLIGQRLRWERGLVTLCLRKFRGALNPFQGTFRLLDAAALLDVLALQFAIPLLLPVYVLWLWISLGSFGVPVLGAVLIGYAVMDLLALTISASLASDPLRTMRLVAYLPIHIVVQMIVLAPVRLIAFLQELLLQSSRRDPYVPRRVMRQVERI